MCLTKITKLLSHLKLDTWEWKEKSQFCKRNVTNKTSTISVQLKLVLPTQKWCSTQSCGLINQSLPRLILPLLMLNTMLDFSLAFSESKQNYSHFGGSGEVNFHNTVILSILCLPTQWAQSSNTPLSNLTPSVILLSWSICRIWPFLSHFHLLHKSLCIEKTPLSFFAC